MFGQNSAQQLIWRICDNTRWALSDINDINGVITPSNGLTRCAPTSYTWGYNAYKYE